MLCGFGLSFLFFFFWQYWEVELRTQDLVFTWQTLYHFSHTHIPLLFPQHVDMNKGLDL
jgi:hypothetical protein